MASQPLPSIESALARVPPLVLRQEGLARLGAAQGSAAFRAGRTRLGRHAWDLSVTALGVAVDHLGALQQMWETRHPVWSHYTLMRSALETACLARWLCEPRVSAAERLGRGVAAQIADLHERAKAEAVATQPLPQVTARQRIQVLTADYAKLRYPPLPNMPSITKLVDAYALPKGGAEMLYRVLSAAAHGKQWAMLPMGDSVVLPAQGPRRSSHVAQIETNTQLAGMLSELVRRAVESALADAEAYGGRSRR